MILPALLLTIRAACANAKRFCQAPHAALDNDAAFSNLSYCLYEARLNYGVLRRGSGAALQGTKPPMAEGMGMPSMMQKMMSGTGDFDPAAMCQAMMTSVGKAAEMAAYATPEVRTLFEEWARSVEDEVLSTLRAEGPMDLVTLGNALKVSPDGVLFFLGKLVRDGKATITGIQATNNE